MLGQLNKDQLDNLAKFCLDLSKGAFIFAAFSSSSQNLVDSINKIFSVIFGVALVFIGMILLKLKKGAT